MRNREGRGPNREDMAAPSGEPGGMKIWVRQLPDGFASVEVHGEVYPNSSAQLQAVLLKLMDAGQCHLLLRLEGVQAVHDSIIGGLVRTLKQMAHRRRGHLAILQDLPTVQLEDLSQFPHLVDHFTIVNGAEEGLDVLQARRGA